jgi:microtubule-associated protein, RP/EB family
LLQAAFSKNHVQRHVDVDKLIRAKYQDNLEFCQWLKAFYDQSGATPNQDYDAKAIRAKGKGGSKYNSTIAKGGGGGGRSNKASVSTNTTINRSRPGMSPRGTSSLASSMTPKPRVPARPHRPTTAGTSVISPTSSSKAPINNNNYNKLQVDPLLVERNDELTKRIGVLETSVVDVEKERDFYFRKLRNIELMLQVKQDKNFDECDLPAMVDNIFKVLYATADDEVAVDENGEVKEQIFLCFVTVMY